MKMPELPPPDAGIYGNEYSADALRAYGEAVRETCAKVCEQIDRNDTTCMGDSVDLSQFAAAIRRTE